MKQTLTILLFILGTSLLSQRIYSQQCKLIGNDICSDGSQSTHISLSGSDPAKLYALYRDGELIEIKKQNAKNASGVIDFDSYSESGKYTAVEFSGKTTSFEKPENGRKINGSVNINKIPVVSVPKKLDAISGRTLNYKPSASISGCTFKWTARLDAGKATGFRKTGAGIMITDTIVVQGNQPASVVYTIIPYSPEYLGSCMGNSQELVVWIKP